MKNTETKSLPDYWHRRFWSESEFNKASLANFTHKAFDKKYNSSILLL